MTRETSAVTKAIAIYPHQVAIVEKFAHRSGRSFSNAVQWIVSQWSTEHPGEWNGGAADETAQEQPA